MVTPVSGMPRPVACAHHANGRKLAHAALARTHGGSGVPLQDLDMVEALLYRLKYVDGSHVVAEANKRFSVLRLCWNTQCGSGMETVAAG